MHSRNDCHECALGPSHSRTNIDDGESGLKTLRHSHYWSHVNYTIPILPICSFPLLSYYFQSELILLYLWRIRLSINICAFAYASPSPVQDIPDQNRVLTEHDHHRAAVCNRRDLLAPLDLVTGTAKASLTIRTFP